MTEKDRETESDRERERETERERERVKHLYTALITTKDTDSAL